MEGRKGVSGGGEAGMVAASMGSGMLGLEMSLHHPHHHTTTTTPSHHPNPNPHPQQQQHHHLLPFPAAAQRHEEVVVDNSHSPSLQQQLHQHLPSPSPSPWQRMKWTDSMVRLLIMIVYCVGDDAGGTPTDHQGDQHGAAASGSGTGSGKGKKAPTTTSAPTSAAAGLLLQKKGKWKSVSRAMMEKGFYVSPQQCEDKFNDLNKRYKRVNELLGKGTACQVVENQALLDSLDHLSPKAKGEARKLLNSKHLFFREMCAYHNSNNTSSSTACAPALPQLPQPPHSQPPHSQSQQPHCLHHPSDSAISISFPASREPLFVDKGGHSNGSMLGGVNEEKDRDHDDNIDIDDDETGDDDDEVEDDEDEEDNDEEGGDKEGFDDNKSKHQHQHQHQHERSNKESKVQAKGTTSMLVLPTSSLSASPPLSLSLSSSPPAPVAVEQLRSDLMGSLASIGGEQQQRQWLKRKAAELEEQRVEYQCQALELKRQRFKWLRFSRNKEREMGRLKLSNKRLCLENDRMLLLLRQKEQELINANDDSAPPTTTTFSNPNPLQFAAVHHNLLHYLFGCRN